MSYSEEQKMDEIIWVCKSLEEELLEILLGESATSFYFSRKMIQLRIKSHRDLASNYEYYAMECISSGTISRMLNGVRISNSSVGAELPHPMNMLKWKPGLY